MIRDIYWRNCYNWLSRGVRVSALTFIAIHTICIHLNAIIDDVVCGLIKWRTQK